jgi:hypothetical protein
MVTPDRIRLTGLLKESPANAGFSYLMGFAVQLLALGAEGCDALVATGVMPAGVWL